MRIFRWSGLPAVVLVRARDVCAVAIPEGLPREEVLELASLVLSPEEYREFCGEVIGLSRTDLPADHRRQD